MNSCLCFVYARFICVEYRPRRALTALVECLFRMTTGPLRCRGPKIAVEGSCKRIAMKLTISAVIGIACLGAAVQSQSRAPLHLVQTLTMDKGVTGRFDH